jgi:hypothetical protein
MRQCNSFPGMPNNSGMLDTLSHVPLWGLALFCAALGAAAGFAQARRGHSRAVGLALLVVGAILAASASAARWDRNTRATPLGGTTDGDERLRLEALGVAGPYEESRQRWMAMSDADRWTWRLSRFGVASVSLLCGGVPPLLWMTRRGAGSSASPQRGTGM